MMFNDKYRMNPCSHGETTACVHCIIQEDPDMDQIPGWIENENPNTTDEQGPAQEIRELALREIPPVLAGRMDLAHYFLKRDDGIDHMVRRDGSSATSVTKNSDLSITIRSEIRVPRRLRYPGLRIHWDHERFWQNHTELMIQELPGAREAPEFSERPFMPGIGACTSTDVVEMAIAQSLGIDEEDLEGLEHRYFEEITELVDPNLAMRAEVMGMSESDPFHPEPVPEVDNETFHTTLNQYNALARYEPVITETMEQARNVALIWWHLILRLPGEIPEPGSPREMAQELRKKLGLRRAEWNVFLKENMEDTWPYDKHGENPARELEDIAIGCRAVARANLKHTCSSLTENILRMVENRQFEELHEQRTWQHGDPRKAWAHIIQQGMLDHQKRCSPRTEEVYGSDACWEAPDEIKAVGHALLDRIRKQERWTRARWEVYRERTRRARNQT